MPTSSNEKTYEIKDFSGAIQRQTTRFLKRLNQVKLSVNVTYDRIGGFRKKKGTAAVGDAISSSGNILNLHGYSKSDGTDRLLAVFGTDLYSWNGSSWSAQSQSLTAAAIPYFETFLDYTFFVNGTDANRSWDGTTWSTTTLLGDAPKASFIAELDVQLYLGSVTIGGVTYKSRVWFSDIPVSSTVLTWGLETGSDLSQTASSAVVTSAGSTFVTNNIKVGDKFVITSGSNAGNYIVKSVDSNTQITLNKTLANNQSDKTFWTGGNFFDVDTDDGDSLTRIYSYGGELLCFKKNSLQRFNPRSLTKYMVEDAVGTTSGKSVIGLNGYVYYFHPKGGILRYAQGSVTPIGIGVKDFLDNIATANYDDVVGWKASERYVKFYIGDVTLSDGESVTDCVLKYDTYSETWEVESYPYAITAGTTWTTSNSLESYIGNELAAIHQDETGSTFSGAAIPWYIWVSDIFPEGEDAILTFTRLRLYLDKPSDLTVQYKLLYKPHGRNHMLWINESDPTPLTGNTAAHRSELTFPSETEVRASGIDILISSSSTESSALVEKILLYYSNLGDY